jgi:hypothetical protein
MSLTKEHVVKKITDSELEYSILKKINDLLCDALQNKNTPAKKDIVKDDKYNVFLRFVNRLLMNNNLPQITDLYDFKNIDRKIIIKSENVQIFRDMEDELFEHFDKMKCGYPNISKGKVLNIMRGMCKQLGLTLLKRQTSKTVKRVVYTVLLYSIV